MHTIHTVFTPEQISATDRFMKNLTLFSIEGAPDIEKEKYSGLLPVNLMNSFQNFKQNAEKLIRSKKKTFVILPPFPNVIDFYLSFCEFVIVRFEGKRKYYRENYPDMTIDELKDFDKNLNCDRQRILIEFSGICKDCNINTQTYRYFTLSQANLKMHIKGSMLFCENSLIHNYYSYVDNENNLHIVWLEDNFSISSYYNFLKEKNYGGVSWKNPSHAADGNWEAMYSVKVKL